MTWCHGKERSSDESQSCAVLCFLLSPLCLGPRSLPRHIGTDLFISLCKDLAGPPPEVTTPCSYQDTRKWATELLFSGESLVQPVTRESMYSEKTFSPPHTPRSLAGSPGYASTHVFRHYVAAAQPTLTRTRPSFCLWAYKMLFVHQSSPTFSFWRAPSGRPNITNSTVLISTPWRLRPHARHLISVCSSARGKIPHSTFFMEPFSSSVIILFCSSAESKMPPPSSSIKNT